MSSNEMERLRRWRLILGEDADNACNVALDARESAIDAALAALYQPEGKHGLRGGTGGSSPKVARWLGDIRQYFPSSVVQVMQKDAFERLNLHSMLLEPEMLANVQPDVHLVSTLMSLNGVIPGENQRNRQACGA